MNLSFELQRNSGFQMLDVGAVSFHGVNVNEEVGGLVLISFD